MHADWHLDQYAGTSLPHYTPHPALSKLMRNLKQLHISLSHRQFDTMHMRQLPELMHVRGQATL